MPLTDWLTARKTVSRILQTGTTLGPGKFTAHTEFTRDGKCALVSIWENDGELVIYDTKTLQIVKQLPMKKPSGKYSVVNKISRSAGTSH
ncbi:cytochrome D1 domain-containing protein [Undibacterium sp.]|uniref:cytochrome D1 domain-containing protein n=1 Tax=Undibacterium sp. TaxID=1914977 RepID=UPI00375190D8